MTTELSHHYLEANGVTLHLACQGEGPLVVLCHGYPGLWYSWRYQMVALATAGYRAVAMDMRGYGRSSRPLGIENYSFDKTSGDVLAVLDHFGEQQAVVFGHDFGANLVWHMAVHHADRIRAMASLCVPYEMPLAGGSDVRPSTLYAQIASEHFFHMHYYQREGIPESSTLGREREFLAKLFWALCAEGDLLGWENFPSDAHYVDVLSAPTQQPPWPWLSLEDFDYYLSEYQSAGPELTFIGGINSYRAMDRNWELYKRSANALVEIPAMYVGGAEDPTVKLGSPSEFEHMQDRVKDLRAMELLPGAGHFIQQESPVALNDLLLKFLDSL
ncbi:MAG: pimeloyl-ACP methyl ester carboxylesterase [Bacteroidia bacterium]